MYSIALKPARKAELYSVNQLFIYTSMVGGKRYMVGPGALLVLRLTGLVWGLGCCFCVDIIIPTIPQRQILSYRWNKIYGWNELGNEFYEMNFMVEIKWGYAVVRRVGFIG